MEGFEDPFAMMKAITEYFRELSVEDTQLGAALPKPTPDQLKQFVESQGEEQIDASREGDTLILRASRIVYDTGETSELEDTVTTLDIDASEAAEAGAEAPEVDAKDEVRAHEEAELERRAKARLMALRKELDPLLAESAEDESSDAHGDAAGSKKDLLPEISMREDSISRLLDEADNKIGGAESRRRSQSIAHLKAAVAASAADKDGRPERVRIREERQKDPYRRDLARAVGKSDELERSSAAERHPAAHGQAQSAKHVPLMLVSNQRVSEDLEVASEVEVASEEEIVAKAVEKVAASASATAAEAYAPTADLQYGYDAPTPSTPEAPASPEAPSVTAEEVPEAVTPPLVTPEEPVEEPEEIEAEVELMEEQVAEEEPAVEEAAEPMPTKAEAEAEAEAAEPDAEVASTEPAEETDSQTGASFGDFAAQHNAKALPELLEAAVAFAQQQSDVDEALRPQVMKLVAEHLGGSYERDEAMRVFGTLLREGRIEKLPKGRFTVPANSALRDHA